MGVNELTGKLLLIAWRSFFFSYRYKMSMAKSLLWFKCCVPSSNVCYGQWTMKHRSHSHGEWVL